MMIVDAHLDLAFNAISGRAVERPAAEQKSDADGTPTVGLPDLRAGNIGLICATIFCEPSSKGGPGYQNAEEARMAALAQLDWYHQREADGSMRFVRRRGDIPDEASPDQTLAILLLEGADPFRSPQDVAFWFDAGLRIVGLAWRQTRYAGGTGAPGPLTAAGVELVKTLDDFKIIHDMSHLAEESFWQLLEISTGPVMASHSNCRSIVPTDRQLSDDMIRAIADRGGIIGVNFFEKFLVPPDEYKKRRSTLKDVVIHLQAMCDAIGDCTHVGLGSDFDGGFGREDIPEEITTAADLRHLEDALSAARFSDEDIARIMGANWVKFFRRVLPG